MATHGEGGHFLVVQLLKVFNLGKLTSILLLLFQQALVKIILWVSILQYENVR
jgi:hypothetical protein